jgi:hypothetical protein
MTTMRRVVFVWTAAVIALVGMAGIAHAQYGARPMGSTNSAVGENYKVEFSLGVWTSDPDIQVSSESLGIIGTRIDAVTDLGFKQETFRDWRVVLRPSKKFKFRFGYTPIHYEAESVLTRDVVFNGQKYTIGVPITSDLDWKVWKIGIEYDFVYGDRGFFGFVTDVKYTNARVDIISPITAEFSKVSVPIPTIGAVARVYLVKGLAVNGELTGMKLSYSDNEGKYIDFDTNVTYNFTNNVGAQFGYRKLHIEYTIDTDAGRAVLKGIYFGGVARF